MGRAYLSRATREMTDTTGKVVTLSTGVVVTDVGAKDEYTRKCIADNGDEHIIINRVIRDLPITHRRKDLP